MLRSMTGFGRAEKSIQEKLFQVELRSLNGKQLDLQVKIPVQFKPYEFDIRNLISEHLQRGSVECMITSKSNGSSKPPSINTELAASIYRQLKGLASDLEADDSQLLASVLRIPEVVSSASEVLSEEDWKGCKEMIIQALDMLNQHRENEGSVLEKDLVKRIDRIAELQVKVMELDPQRKKRIRENMLKLMEEHVGKESVDMNRFEQELIYYIEKIDLTEEQVRLSNHCDYFKKMLAEKEISKGRKLSFLLQEIGREINTTGSKAYDSEIQKIVVDMKDELEKAKEQVLNVL